MNCVINNRIVIFSLMLILINACSSIEQSYEEYLNKGIELYSQGEFGKAKIELQNAIQKKPEAAQPHFYMALINEKSQNFKAMRLNLEQAIKLKPDYVEAMEKLAKVYLLFNDVEQSAAEVEAIKKLDPENLTAATVSAQILEKQEKSDEAMAIVSQVLAKDPDFVDALALKTVLLLKKQNYDQSLETIEHALSIDSKNVSFHLLKIQLHGLQNDVAAVLDDYRALMKIQPDNDEIKYALAKAYVKEGDRQSAETILRNLVKDKPNNTKAKLMLLEFLSGEDKKKTYDQLDSFLSSSKPVDRIELAKWILSKQDNSKAREILNNILSDPEDDQKVKQTALFLLAGLKFREKDYRKSSELIDQLLSNNPDYTDAKVLKASILLVEDRYPEAEELLNNVLWENPKSDNAMILLAKIYLERGEKDKANNKFLDAFKVNPSNKLALLPLVDQALKHDHYDYAKELIRTSLSRGGQGLDLLQMLARIDMAEKDWKGAEKVIKIIEQRKNGQLLGMFLSAQMFTQQEKYQQAIDLYQQILDQFPWHVASLAALASNYEKIDKRDRMIHFLDEFSRKHPNNTAAQLLKSRFLILDNKVDEAIELLRRYLTTNPSATSVSLELARLNVAKGNNEAAMEYYQQGLQKRPNNIKLLMSLASFYEQQRQLRLAIETYEKVLKFNPTMDIAKNNLAAVLLEQGPTEDIARAVQLTNKFKKSDQPYFLDSYGWAQFKNNNTNEALLALKKVITMAPEIPVFRYHLAAVYDHLNNRTNAILELREALELGKKTPFVEAGLAKNLLDELLESR